MRDVSSQLIILCLLLFKLTSGTLSKYYPRQMQQIVRAPTTDVSLLNDRNMKDLENCTDCHSNELHRIRKKTREKELHPHGKPFDQNVGFFSNKRHRPATVRFRSNHEEKVNKWPKVKFVPTWKNGQENLQRNISFFSNKRHRPATVRFRSNHEKKVNKWPKVKFVPTWKNRQEILQRNASFFSRKRSQPAAVRFRSNHEKKINKWPKVNFGPIRKNWQENLPRSTRLDPGLEKLSLREGDDDDPFYSPWLRFNPFSFKKVMQDNMKKITGINVTVEVIAKTVEYNDIVLCKIQPSKISKLFRANEEKYAEEEPERKIVLIVHGLSCMGFNEIRCLSNEVYFRKLLDIYMKHLDKFDIYLVPMANPDCVGDSTLQFWNKNKSPQAACLGVALDRNFDVSWNSSYGSSCSQQYPGPEAFSEVESRAIADLMHTFSHKLVGYIHVHSGTYNSGIFKGDAVLYPRGFSDSPVDDDKYIDMKGDIDEAMRTAGFKTMSVTVDSLYNWYGKIQGSSVDYAATIYGIPFALEFVMQIYEDSPVATTSHERVSSNVLTEVWGRVIGAVFENIHKNTKPDD